MSSKITNSGLGASEATLALSDVTTSNVSTARHGFAPKLPNDATKYLDGSGAFSAPIISSHVTTQFDKTNNTLADVPGLSITLGVGTYAIRAELSLLVINGTGAQIKMTGTIVRSADSLWLTEGDDGSSPGLVVLPFDSAVSLNVNLVSLGGHLAIITGTVIVTTGGTLKVQFAQDSTNATAASVLVGSSIMATPIS